MILVASSASSLAIYREIRRNQPVTAFPGELSDGFMASQEFEVLAVEILVPLTLACVLIRLRHPRPSIRRIGRQPGFAACVSALLPIVIHAIEYLANAYRRGEGVQNALSAMRWLMIDSSGFCVAATWLVLAIGSRWQVEAGWIDRLGIAIGAAWVALSLLDMIDVFF